ncbi:hypothetical protein HK104_007439, partial [Borealophlyctis nickersoniae]
MTPTTFTRNAMLAWLAMSAAPAQADHQAASHRGEPHINNPAVMFVGLTNPPPATVKNPESGAPPTFAIKLNAAELGGASPKNTGLYRFRMPDPFGYQNNFNNMLENPDNFVRSNIDNRQNTRNTDNEKPLDMMPCRQGRTLVTPMKLTEGQNVQFPSRWANPHNSECEVNVWIPSTNATTGFKIMTLRRPFPAGGGYQSGLYPFTVPTQQNLATLCAPGKGCILQMYCHSVETRTYTVCTDVSVSGAAKPLAPRQLNPATKGNGTTTAATNGTTATAPAGTAATAPASGTSMNPRGGMLPDGCPTFTPNPTLAALVVTEDDPRPEITSKEFNQFPCTGEDYGLRDAIMFWDSFDT